MVTSSVLQWRPDYAKAMIICADNFEDGIVSGILHNFYFKETVAFKGLDQLVFAMDLIMDMVGFPQSAMNHGRLNIVKNADARQFTGNGVPYYKIDELKPMRGRLFTVHIRVFYRQNCSMQGTLTYQGQSLRFRSVLELMCLLYEMAKLPDET